MRTRALVVLLAVLFCLPAAAQEPSWQRDRGTGVATSLFGTYVRKGELLIYPFVEYYKDKDAEYKPAEMGFFVDEDFTGRYRASEALLFLGYGLTDNLALEFEAATIKARLHKSPEDPSDMPEVIEESGIGDVAAQLRWRMVRETGTAPELFSYFETVFPLQKDKLLIGTGDWEHKLGFGAIKGLGIGTVTFRAAVEYTGAEGKVELGEYAFEYLRRLNDRWRVYAGIEGTQDEVEFITEAQWFIRPGLYLKLNNAVGMTPKATDWAPEVGLMFSF